MTKRKEIYVKLGTESFYDILDQRTPEQVIAEMQAFIETYQGRKITFNVAPYGYDGGLELELWESREETDREFEKRRTQEKVAAEKARKARETKKARALAQALATEADERALLAQLREKYKE